MTAAEARVYAEAKKRGIDRKDVSIRRPRDYKEGRAEQIRRLKESKVVEEDKGQG